MPTEKPRITFTVTEDELERINEYRFKYKFKNLSQSILDLIEKGFVVLNSDIKINNGKNMKSEAVNITLKEHQRIKKYRALDERGKVNVDNLLDSEFNLVTRRASPDTIAAHMTDDNWTEENEAVLNEIKEVAEAKRRREGR